MLRMALCVLAFGISLTQGQIIAAPFQAKRGRLPTQWSSEVNSNSPLPDFPRPQMQRPNLPWLSLNGAWQWAPHDLEDTEPPFGRDLNSSILVPFPPESALSGLELNGTSHMWYRTMFIVPEQFLAADNDSQPLHTLLHFGAVDWQSAVYVNGKQLGVHKGGYDSFTYDITDAISKNAAGPHEVVLDVWDPTEAADGVPLGKQRAHTQPGGITYTACSGIWQTVWLEAVPSAQITGVNAIPDIDAGHIVVTVKASAAATGRSVVTLVHNNNYAGPVIGSGLGLVDGPMTIPVPDAQLWSPDTPNLYALTTYLFKPSVNISNLPKFTAEGLLAAPEFNAADVIDTVQSYTAMRKFAACRDEKGVLRSCLNNKPIVMLGLLDQGFWPDGIYTAPTDPALKSDIVIAKSLGFNTLRKHVKVEPDRWYYHADTVGMLVWQDMPSMCGQYRDVGNDTGYPTCWNRTDTQDHTIPDYAIQQFNAEMSRMILNHVPFPSIVMYEPFNEGWGEFPESAKTIALAQSLDASRVVNGASGWTHSPPFRGGEVLDIHDYNISGPTAPMFYPTTNQLFGSDVGTAGTLISVVGMALW